MIVMIDDNEENENVSVIYSPCVQCEIIDSADVAITAIS